MNYETRLNQIGIMLLEPLRLVKQHHLLKCLNCNHEWSGTPISKIQGFSKHGHNGCPVCDIKRRDTRKAISRKANLQKIADRGLEILSNYDGRMVKSITEESIPIDVTVRNKQCGHTFTSSSKNLLTRNVNCPICNKERKRKAFQQFNIDRHIRAQTGDWLSYKHKVYMLTRSTYHKHKLTINPLNLPRGLAGVVGAYQLDHKRSVKWCYENYIPASECAHPDNLQMLDWLSNIVKR